MLYYNQLRATVSRDTVLCCSVVLRGKRGTGTKHLKAAGNEALKDEFQLVNEKRMDLKKQG